MSNQTTNEDHYAFPTFDENGAHPDEFNAGLTKREYFATNVIFNHSELSVSDKNFLEALLDRSVDTNDAFDMLNAGYELEAKIRVMKADALIKELNK